MDVREKLVELLSRTLPYGKGTLYTIADDLIAHFVTVRDVYDCEHCKNAIYAENPFTVITQMGREVKTQFYFCPNCGRRLPQPPKGETIYCKDCEHLMFSDCYGECANGHKGIVNPNDTCEHAKRKPPKGE